MPPQRTRLRRGSLNREVILDAAIRVLARPGASSFTMRALADELGADPTAVYRHFNGNDDLLGALTDRLLDQLALPEQASGWRAQLAGVALALHELFERTPGAVPVLAESPFTPASLRTIETTVAKLVADGLPADLAVEACQAVVLYAIGQAVGASHDPAGFWSGAVDGAVPARDFPALIATADAWRAPPDKQFKAGLSLLLDGVGFRMAEGRRSAAP